MGMTVAVKQRHQLDRPGLESRLLVNLALDCAAGTVTDISEATGEGPQTVGALLHHEDAFITKHRGADIHARRGITVLALEQFGYGLGLGTRAGGDHRGGDITHLIIALAVI